MARIHVNPQGVTGVCTADPGNCPFSGEDEHYASHEEARAAFEAKNDTFSVVITKGNLAAREVNAVDANLSQRMAIAEQEYAAAEDSNSWIENKVNAVINAQAALTMTLPGTPLREEMTRERAEAREALLAADLVVWRDSPFYNEGVENRMKTMAFNVADADSSIEGALADEAGKTRVANENNISTRDVENILELVQADYTRGRGSLTNSISDLSTNEVYAADTAYVFRISPQAAQAVIDYAASYSSIEKKTTASQSWDDLIG